jgi:geranylgeranyl diphosphate synthase type II
MNLATVGAELEADRYIVNDYLARLLSVEAARANGMVQEAMGYAVLGPAQRIRPILALRVARMLRSEDESVLCAAAAVELLHCASLIVDDLPCMDDADLRRNQPAVHVRFGEANAVLAAFGLVALAARTLVECEGGEDCRQALADFQIRLLRSLDCSGLIAGQALDLHFAGQQGLRTQHSVTELKTVPLFHLAVSAGSLLATLNVNERALLDCFGREFGLAFQMTDDLIDGDDVEIGCLQEKFGMMRAAAGAFGPRRRNLEELVDYLDARVPLTLRQ